MELSDVAASRVLFGFTAAYHFLFVPLTVGLMAMIALFEGIALRTGNRMWRRAARFFALPFLVNFGCGMVTGYPLRWQIAQHWSAYAEVVGTVFDAVFRFEGRLAPLMLALVGAFAIGWRLPRHWHFLVSSALALVLILQSSAILMLNAWMQHPLGVRFADGVARPTRLAALWDNPLVQSKIVHTMGAAWVLGGMFVVAVSAWFLLRGRHLDMARGCLKVASRFTLLALLVTAAAGHISGERLARHQPMKFAAIEALWDTGSGAPDLLLLGWPDAAQRSNRVLLAVPGALEPLAGVEEGTLRGIRELVAETADRIRDDLQANPQARFDPRALGPVALLGAPRGGPIDDAQIEAAARAAVPNVPMVFWAFRIMLGVWLASFVLMLAIVWRCPDPKTSRGRRLLALCVAALPLPWIAIEAGWIVCEVGRQPWTVTGLLPTARSIGAVPADVALTRLLAAVVAGAVILVINIGWHLAHVRRGPRSRRREAAAWAPTRLISRRRRRRLAHAEGALPAEPGRL